MLLSLLAEHVRRYRPGDDPERWLFPNGRDETLPMHAGVVSRLWGAAGDRANLGYRLHDLLHFYASGLIRAGCDVVTVQRALGHSSATTTLHTYSHPWPDANDRTRRAAGELLRRRWVVLRTHCGLCSPPGGVCAGRTALVGASAALAMNSR